MHEAKATVLFFLVINVSRPCRTVCQPREPALGPRAASALPLCPPLTNKELHRTQDAKEFFPLLETNGQVFTKL